MFEDIKKIPYNTTELRDEYQNFLRLWTDVKEYISTDRVVDIRWQSYNDWGIVARALLHINALNVVAPITKRAIFNYYIRNDYSFQNDVEKLNELSERFGIIIHEQARTYFRESDFDGFIHLEGAEKVLKQTQTHFLKIMKHPKAEVLIVYTNQELSFENCYKLNELQTKLFLDRYPEASRIPYEIAKALTNKDVNTFIQILTNLFNSDEFQKLRMERLKGVFRYDTERQINEIESRSTNLRTEITNLENRIATYAREIRTLSENMERLKSRNLDEEFELTCKYLWKNPYIKNYNPTNSGEIIFDYTAPLIYYDETPVEKMLKNDHYSDYKKAILTMLLDRRFELYTQCRINFNTVSFNTNSVHIGNGPLLGHPHIDRFNCFGNHRDAIFESAASNDYIGAIEQISQAILNLNFYDVCVIDYTLSALRESQDTLHTWKDTETNEMLTTNEALKRGGYYEKVKSEQ